MPFRLSVILKSINFINLIIFRLKSCIKVLQPAFPKVRILSTRGEMEKNCKEARINFSKFPEQNHISFLSTHTLKVKIVHILSISLL